MAKLYKYRLLVRLLTLGVLTLCLSILSRNGSDTPFVTAKESQPLPIQTQAPTLTVKAQTDTPLLISSPRILSWDGRGGEFAFELINVSSKPIRAYAIRQRVEAGGTQSSNVSFSSLDLTSHPSLQPNQSLTTFDTCQAIPEKEQRITLFVDYVEFSDGTKWGEDSARSADRSAGQRVAAYLISKRLLKILDEGNSTDVMKAIEAGVVNIELPADRSDEWKEGFHSGSNSVTAYLKNAKKRGDLKQVELKLRQLAERFKGVN
jgi:hypothetical protein